MLQILIFASTFLMTVSSLILGFFVLLKSPKVKVNILWFLTCMAVTLWGLGYILVMTSSSDNVASIYLKITYFSIVVIPVLFFHFICSFLYQDKKYKSLIWFGYAVSALFFILILGSKFIINGIKHLDDFGRYEEINPIFFNFFMVYFLFFALFGMYILIQNRKSSDIYMSRKIIYVLIAAIICFFAGIFNFARNYIGIYPYGQLIIWVYPLFITYGVFMDPIRIRISKYN